MQIKKALLIAVETYQSTINSVPYAEADAKALAGTLDTLGCSPDNIEVLLSQIATKTTIESKVRRFLRKVGKDDQVLFFYAGHGFSANDRNFVTCHDTQPGDLIQTSIALQDLLEQFRDSSRCTILFLDSCHSGLEIDARMRGVYRNISDQELQEFFEGAEYCVGFASCKADEASHSHDDLGHGIWTYYLLRALQGKDISALTDGRFVTASSLQGFLLRSVQSAVKTMFSDQRAQTPCMFGNMTKDFLIADLGKKLGSRPEEWPRLTAVELSVYSRLLTKAMECPLTEEDLDQLRNIVEAYHRRVGMDLPESQVFLGSWMNEIAFQYQYELGQCMLISFDGKQPFISKDLEQLTLAMYNRGARRSQLDADWRRILSCAHRTAWVDEFGKKFHPLTRDEILAGLRRSQIARDNLDKLWQLFHDLASRAVVCPGDDRSSFMAIMEHERVVLTVAIPGEGLEAGDVGSVVHVCTAGHAYEVEFTTLDGHTAAVVTVEANQVRPVSRRDIAHARTIPAGSEESRTGDQA